MRMTINQKMENTNHEDHVLLSYFEVWAASYYWYTWYTVVMFMPFFLTTLKEISCLNFKTTLRGQKVTPARFYCSA